MQYPQPSPTLTAVFPFNMLLEHLLGAFSPMGQAWFYLRWFDGWAEVVANIPGERAPLVIDDLVNVRFPFLHVLCVPSVLRNIYVIAACFLTSLLSVSMSSGLIGVCILT